MNEAVSKIVWPPPRKKMITGVWYFGSAVYLFPLNKVAWTPFRTKKAKWKNKRIVTLASFPLDMEHREKLAMSPGNPRP